MPVYPVFKFEDDDLDMDQFEGWYGLRARDLIDEKQSADTNSYDPERMLESLKNFANESLKGEDARWIKGIIENNKKKVISVEGLKTTEWVIVDFGDIILNIFKPETLKELHLHQKQEQQKLQHQHQLHKAQL